ncbi:hypothetical protein E2C01_062895 [Portunus trituberculatus]|uniref:Uncharacterized protein n=1 Tax=Portunus trituberculatus TaxID=210409 RepID=A0A5B7H7R5_PORTR|nr:hypothetical protein [Portunus trituberculatus]
MPTQVLGGVLVELKPTGNNNSLKRCRKSRPRAECGNWCRRHARRQVDLSWFNNISKLLPDNEALSGAVSLNALV